MIFNTFKEYFLENKKRKKELEFQRQWKEFKWDYILDCIEEYWKQYRYFDDVIKIIQPRDKIVLDVGCGVISVLNLLHNLSGNFYGIDPLMDEYKKIIPSLHKDVKWIKSKGEKLPFDNEFFDVVICSNVLDHVEKPLHTIKEINRVLKPSGKFLLTVDIFRDKVIRDEAHPHCFKEEDVLRMADKNFNILFSKKSELNAQVMLFVKKEIRPSELSQEIIVIAEKIINAN